MRLVFTVLILMIAQLESIKAEVVYQQGDEALHEEIFPFDKGEIPISQLEIGKSLELLKLRSTQSIFQEISTKLVLETV